MGSSPSSTMVIWMVVAGAEVVALVDDVVGVVDGVEGGGGVARHGGLGVLGPRGDLRDGRGDGGGARD